MKPNSRVISQHKASLKSNVTAEVITVLLLVFPFESINIEACIHSAIVKKAIDYMNVQKLPEPLAHEARTLRGHINRVIAAYKCLNTCCAPRCGIQGSCCSDLSNNATDATAVNPRKRQGDPPLP